MVFHEINAVSSDLTKTRAQVLFLETTIIFWGTEVLYMCVPFCHRISKGREINLLNWVLIKLIIFTSLSRHSYVKLAFSFM